MKAIETVYNGYKFRSRLEARWAVFFDALGVEWEYEKQGFDLDEAGKYLPDFWLPGLDCWIEIKGSEPTESEQDKGRLLGEHTGKRVVCFFGRIEFFDKQNSNSGYLLAPYWDNLYFWCVCPDCGAIDIRFEGRSDRMPCKKLGCPRHSGNQDREHTYNHPRIMFAILAARQARFEYGESGFSRSEEETWPAVE